MCNVPPLRDRNDILYLSERLLAHTAGQLGKPPPNLTAQDRKQLLRYAWPGNVRELENALTGMVVASQMSISLGETSSGSAQQDTTTPLKHRIRSQTNNEIDGAKRKATSCAAELLGISRAHLYRLLRKQGAD